MNVGKHSHEIEVPQPQHYGHLGAGGGDGFSYCYGLACALRVVRSSLGLHPLDASSTQVRGNNPKCLQTLPDVAWGTPWVENQ